MQKLNRYLLETDKLRAQVNYTRSEYQREKAEFFRELTCANCGWNINPTTPHWTPSNGHSGGVYHIQCYTPGLPTPDQRSRKTWQCFCGHECRCPDYKNGTGLYGAGCNNCDRNHYGQDCNYEYNTMPHECSLCGWTILPIEIPILNKHKENYNYPHGWMHEVCYKARYEELLELDKTYIPITLTLPEGEILPDEYDEDGKPKDDKQQWVRSIEKQKRLVEELAIWQSFGVVTIPE